MYIWLKHVNENSISALFATNVSQNVTNGIQTKNCLLALFASNIILVVASPLNINFRQQSCQKLTD